MKRFIAFVLCAFVVVCSLTVVAFAEEVGPKVAEPTITELIVGYVKGHLEEVMVIVTLLLSIFYNAMMRGAQNKAISTLNNNAITVAENGNKEVSRASAAIDGYSAKIEEVLAEFRVSSEERKRLEDELVKADAFIEKAKLANVELANELAELLCLANIPNAKKEELYARHMDAVKAIDALEVTHHDGEEA